MTNLEQKAKELEAQLPKGYPNFYELYADNRELLKAGYGFRISHSNYHVYLDEVGILRYSNNRECVSSVHTFIKITYIVKPPEDPNESDELCIKTVEQFQDLVYQAQKDGHILEVEEYFESKLVSAILLVTSRTSGLGQYYAIVLNALACKQKGVTFKVRREG